MIRRAGKIKSLFLCFLILSALSCNRSVIFTDSFALPEKKWTLNDIPSFSFSIPDSAANLDVSFTIRTGSDYPFRNIYLFVSTISPGGKSLTDTLEYFLADEKGNWYGKGFGDIHELTLPYKSRVFFPENGTYQMKIIHGMRPGELKGVYDLGLRIEHSGK